MDDDEDMVIFQIAKTEPKQERVCRRRRRRGLRRWAND